MITNWSPELPPPDIKIAPLGWLRFALKAPMIGILVFGGLLVLLLVRLVERPLCGMDRPVTPYITLFVCRNTLRLIGIDYRVIGEPMKGPGAVVANHVSWMDISSSMLASASTSSPKPRLRNGRALGGSHVQQALYLSVAIAKMPKRRSCSSKSGCRTGTNCCSFQKGRRRMGAFYCRSSRHSSRHSLLTKCVKRFQSSP